MKPFVKWPGGKQEEYEIIKEYFPKEITKYIEPFVGGGAVFLKVNSAEHYYINDKSSELILLYEYIKKQDEKFFNKLKNMIYNWRLMEDVLEIYQEELLKKYIDYSNDLINEIEWSDYIVEFIMNHKKEFNGILETTFNVAIKNFINELIKSVLNKTKRMKKLEKTREKLSYDDMLKNIETAFKAAYYNHFRHVYNFYENYNVSEEFRVAIFYFLREFCYSSMFRYNKSGHFNVPYGGMSYNRKNIEKKIENMHNVELISKMKKTNIYDLDFENMLQKVKVNNNDFIFLDPPYDSEFSTYDKNTFGSSDHKRLFNFLNETNANFMLVIKNTPFISNLYSNGNFNIQAFDKKYLVSFQNRNSKEVEHLVITNY